MPFILPSFAKPDNANHSENQCSAELAVTVSQNLSLLCESTFLEIILLCAEYFIFKSCSPTAGVTVQSKPIAEVSHTSC